MDEVQSDVYHAIVGYNGMDGSMLAFMFGTIPTILPNLELSLKEHWRNDSPVFYDITRMLPDVQNPIDERLPKDLQGFKDLYGENALLRELKYDIKQGDQ